MLVFMTCLAHSRNSIQNLLNRIILHFFWVLSNWDKSPMANKQEILIPMYPAFLPSFSTCRKKRKKERKLIAQSCPTLRNPMDCSLPGSFLCPWNSLGKSTGVGCHARLQGIFPNWDRTLVSCTAGRFFTTEPKGKV